MGEGGGSAVKRSGLGTIALGSSRRRRKEAPPLPPLVVPLGWRKKTSFNTFLSGENTRRSESWAFSSHSSTMRFAQIKCTKVVKLEIRRSYGRLLADLLGDLQVMRFRSHRRRWRLLNEVFGDLIVLVGVWLWSKVTRSGPMRHS